MDQYHLTLSDGQWKLKKVGAARAQVAASTKEEALLLSVRFMRDHGGSMVVHKENGDFQSERTYPRSADPRRSPG